MKRTKWPKSGTREILVEPQDIVKIVLPHGGHVFAVNASFLPVWISIDQSQKDASGK